MSWNLISTPFDECQSRCVATLRATRPWRHNLCALPLVRCKTIDPFFSTSFESYLTKRMLLYTLELFSAFARLYNAAVSPATCLSYNEHIIKTASNCLFKLRQINRIKHLLNSKTLLLVINSFVFSKLQYCSTVWSNTSNSNIDKLQKVQNFAGRIIIWD